MPILQKNARQIFCLKKNILLSKVNFQLWCEEEEYLNICWNNLNIQILEYSFKYSIFKQVRSFYILLSYQITLISYVV